MKKIIFYSLFAYMILCAACSNYLDVIPDNVATLDYAFKDRVRAEQYLFTCYNYMPRHGLPQFPGRFDDLVWTHPNMPSLPQYGYTILRDGNNVTNPVLNYWDGAGGGTNLWQAIRDCNTFIERVNEVKDMESYEKNKWAAEAKFLKAYYHFFLLQMYGPIPIVKENLPVTATKEQVMVYREPVDDIINYIVQLIDESVKDLPLKVENETSEQGRITQAVALAMKAKILVTAASPLFNGNTDYASMVDNKKRQLFNQTVDPKKWERAAIACKNAIDTCQLAGLSLYKFINPTLNLSEQTRLVVQVGQIVTDKWNSEHIWGTDAFGGASISEEYTIAPLDVSHYSFSRSLTNPTLKAVELFYSKNGVPIEEDLTYDYTHRYDLTLTTATDKYYVQPDIMAPKLHLNRESRFYGSIGIDGGWWFGLGRFNQDQQWPIKSKYGQVSGPRGMERFSITTFFIKKLANFNSSYNGTAYTCKRWDFPILRLADLYLLYAEALNETMAAPNSDVFKYLDLIRDRAGLKGVVESWNTYSKYPQKYATKEGMRDIIQRERSIELAFEEQRLWDVRRWNKATENLAGTVKGWNYFGTGNVDFYRVTPINNVEYTQRDVFWPIRQYDLSVNTNLIQNPGW